MTSVDQLEAWSRPVLERVPGPDQAPAVADRMRRHCGLDTTSPIDLDELCRVLRIDASEVDLGAAKGGLQGLLMPHHGGRFSAEIDPEPRRGWATVDPDSIAALRRHRRRFLLCHEAAHTLFYETGAKPFRLAPNSQRQETFCDEVARALLVPPMAAAELPFCPDSVVKVQRRFDVSMQVAIRSVTTAHAAQAWLLLSGRNHDLKVQWTSADRDLTGRALPKLRVLARLARRMARTGRCARSGDLCARFLEDRGQLIVTAA
jgi:hypothetical protein